MRPGPRLVKLTAVSCLPCKGSGPTPEAVPRLTVAHYPPDDSYAAPIFLALAIALGLSARATLAQDVSGEEFFETNIRPLFVAHCAKCHGADKQSGGLRVDSRAAPIAGGDRGAAIVPGDPDHSLLVAAVRHGDDLAMPPDERLPERNVADLVAWIRAGAVWPDHARPRPMRSPRPGIGPFSPSRTAAPPEDPVGLGRDADRSLHHGRTCATPGCNPPRRQQSKPCCGARTST